jgi:hypothetical protein
MPPGRSPRSPEVGPIYRQAVQRHLKQRTKLGVPGTGLQMHQRGPRSRGDVGLEASGQPVAKKGVRRAKAQVALPCQFRRLPGTCRRIQPSFEAEK